MQITPIYVMFAASEPASKFSECRNNKISYKIEIRVAGCRHRIKKTRSEEDTGDEIKSATPHIVL